MVNCDENNEMMTIFNIIVVVELNKSFIVMSHSNYTFFYLMKLT